MIIIHTDGLCEPINPKGVATYGIIIRDENGELIFIGSGLLGEGKGMTNQVAEYYAVIHAMEVLVSHLQTEKDIIIYTDSMLVAEQMNGHWRATKGAYLEYYLNAKEYAKVFKNLMFQWIPREENKEADELSRKAYEDWMLAHGRTVKYGRRR